MSPFSCLSSVTRATAALFSLVILVVAVSTSPFPSQAADKKPVAVKDVARATAGKWTRFKVLSNDFDPDGTKVRLKSVKQPKHGKARVKKNKTIKYKPKKSARGRDVIRYVIRDRNGKGKRAKGKVVVNVQGPTPSMAEMCDAPGVLFCEDFEDPALAQANKNRCPNPSHPAHLCPRIQSGMGFEGSALQLTTDGSLGSDMTGIVSFPFPGVSTGWVYTHMRMRFGDGFNAYSAAGGFPGSKGDKFFILAGDGETCSFPGGEMVVGDGKKRGFVSMSHSCGPGVRNEIPGNDFDIQPIDGIIGDCTYLSHKADDISGCAQQQDDVWHNFELAVFPAQSGQRARVKLWLDGVLVTDWESKPNPSSGFAWKGIGPYDEIYLTNYQTDHDDGADAGTGTYGDGLWRIWYDNLVVSTECITTC